MSDGDKIGTIVNDPDFQSLGLADQQQFLSKVDPDFGKLKTGEFSTFLARYKGAQQSPEQQQISQLPNPALQAKQQIAGAVQSQPPIMQRLENWWKTPTQTTVPSNIPGVEQDLQGVTNSPRQSFGRGSAILAAEGGPALISSAIATPVATGLGVGGGIIGGAVGERAGRAVGEKVGAPELGSDVGQTLGGLLGGTAGAKGAGMLPNASRAGAAMNQIVGANKDLPVPAFEATAEAVRAKEMFQAGAPSLPAPMRRFLTRVMDPDKPPVTLGEARDFYTNATKQTAKEWSEMSAPMKRQMAQFTKALGDNIEAALNQNNPGQGTALRQAMDEYGSAMNLKSNVIKAIKWGGAAVGADAVTRILAKRFGGK